MHQIDLFRVVDPSKLCRFPVLRRTLQRRVALPKHDEAGTLSELFLIEKESVRTFLDVINEFDSCKGSPDIDFNPGLFKILIDLEKETGARFLPVQGFETSSMPFQGVK
jgi:hypothetical protein